MESEKLIYPSGWFKFGKKYSCDERKKVIEEIETLPSRLEQISSLLSGDQLDKSYKPRGLSAQQLINHLGDLCINAYVRTKCILTEDNPTIKIYDENLFNHLPGSSYMANTSINIISNVTQRWVLLLCAIDDEDFKRKLYNSEYNVSIQLDELIALYAWRGNSVLARLEIIQDTNTSEFK
jgi:hypothetical protein